MKAPQGTPMELVGVLVFAALLAAAIFYWQTPAQPAQPAETPQPVVIVQTQQGRRWGEGNRLRDLWEKESDDYYRRQMDVYARGPSSSRYY